MQTTTLGPGSSSIPHSLRVLLLVAACAVPAVGTAQSAAPACPLGMVPAGAGGCAGADTISRHPLDAWHRQEHARTLAARRQFVAEHNAQRQYAEQQLAAAMDNRRQWEQTMAQVRRQHMQDLLNGERLQQEYLSQRQAAGENCRQAPIEQQQ